MNVVDTHLMRLDHPSRGALTNICKIVKELAPEAVEVISYGMPGYKYKNKYLITFSQFKDHMSIFPGSGAVEAHKDQLVEFTLSEGTVQFTTEHQIPNETLTSIIKYRLSDIEKKQKP